ncbi:MULTISPECIES: O-antigen ligase [unclassified Dehalobacter]|uniref:O-antigen ligase family protein n=1 Tax=unclassified Dehalobacter TaxID=2635733 RepID=UPI000372ABA0|nr:MULTISPECIES: O-antigen ligase family protein [unclassified Dehalobacter]RJE48976.1 hypothetical protein A7K50_07620 [Dehalobacter sp. MCB1]TCX51713.1 hypothetical protein C1I36_05120 [Dehalobacter sp. 14DCB1]TCX52773.1 hypothetical protein C1I38_06800 [Dehalobacter sp. 12DCB1]
MILSNRIKIVDILIVLYIFGSIVLDPGDNLLRLIKVLLVIPCIIYIMKSQKLYLNTYVKWMLAFSIFAGLSFSWALSIDNAAYRYQTLVLNFIGIYCLLVYIKNQTDRITLILNTMVFAPMILEMRVVMSFGLLAFQDTRNLDSIMSSNLIGMRAGIAVVLGAYLFLTGKKYRIIYLFSMALNTGIVILSGSRKAILFMLIPLLLYYIFSQSNILKRLRNALLAIGLVCVAFYAIMNIPFVYDMVGSRFETLIYGFIGTGKTDGSTSMRLKMIEWGLEWFKMKPWIGYGINNYMSLLGTMKTYAGTTGVYAHNNYIELLVDLGMIGTAIYYFIYFKMLEKAVRLKKRLAPLQLIMVTILVSIIVNEYGMVSYIDIYTQIILALTWTLLFRQEEKVNGKGGGLRC